MNRPGERIRLVQAVAGLLRGQDQGQEVPVEKHDP
jgi:hypothetical protein